MLDDLVKEGELPPVEERLPDDPIVIEPFDRIGQYGGKLRIFTGGTAINAPEYPVIMDPQVSDIMPNLAQVAKLGLGYSMEHQQPVNELIGERLLLTVAIAFCSLLLTWVIALPIGIVSAVKQYSLVD